MGALFYDIAALPSSDPSCLRKREFVQARHQSQFSQESRSLEFLVAGVLQNGQGGIRGFSREEACVQEIIEKSLDKFRKASVQRIPSGYDADLQT